MHEYARSMALMAQRAAEIAANDKTKSPVWGHAQSQASAWSKLLGGQPITNTPNSLADGRLLLELN
jgi:hypothetical protein